MACPLSDYAKKLDEDVKKRYCEKIATIGIDPNIIPEKNFDPDCLPPLESLDLTSFLVLETSFYTKEQFKAFRQLESYQQLVSGWIKNVAGHIVNNKFVVLAKVRHSQKLNDPCVPLWIIVEQDGIVLSAHCLGCMAGQGECCSHVASVLFYLEASNKIRGKLSCTQSKCEWILPRYAGDIEYAEVKNINFRSARKLKQQLDEKIENLRAVDCNAPASSSSQLPTTSAKSKMQTKPPARPVPTQAELKGFYAKLDTCKAKPVALSLISPYSKSFVSKSRDVQTIPDLFDKKYLDLEYHELLNACATTEVKLTQEEIKIIEEDTRSQSKGGDFFRHRAGRIGASQSKAACHTNPAQPSQSLIKTICYPKLFSFATPATEHGCKHESTAIKAYEQVMKQKHINFKVEECGSFVHQTYPWIHATPDFLCSCDCCGKGCGEVKCPYCLKDSSLNEYCDKNNSCLKNQNGVAILRRDNQYYYQSQQQIFTVVRSYCDFVVCAVGDNVEISIERILPDTAHWESVLPKLNQFWRFCILPEILGRWFTRKCSLAQPPPETDAICFCRRVSVEQVVVCSNSSCPISSYHMPCLKVSATPNKWLCPLCHKSHVTKKKVATKQTSDAVVQKAVKLSSVCVCKEKALETDKLLECHSPSCHNGIFFHLKCVGYNRLPNNARTTWKCSACSQTSSRGQKRKGVCDNSTTDDDSVEVLGSVPGNGNKTGSLAKLTEAHYRVILSPTEWLDCDIIQQVHICLQKINPNIEGLQRTTLGPTRSFDRVSGEFLQILHTGQDHWVLVSTIGRADGIVDLYDSLYHSVIVPEVEEQVKDLVGPENFSGFRVVPVQQQGNGFDCGVFASAFATCLAYGVVPETVQFDESQMRSHLFKCLRAGKLELFPVYYCMT